LGGKLQIYNEIEQSFIKPHLSGKGEKNYSMLLYGPPGTGKTTIAENIAKALKRNLIQITVSDFLEGGGAQVEARAKNIFAVLMAQPSSVILFDEIDHFLLDRDSQRYSEQDTLFQFMTPGMLTKLNDLRRKESVIFIIATNYEDRIDSAIKRVGRIDKKYIVLPPDLSKRIEMLKERTKDDVFFNNVTNEDQWNTWGAKAVFLGYNDIKNAVSLFTQVESRTVENFNKILGNMARTTSLEAYTSRFSPSRENEKLDIRKTPLCEFLCLVALRLETISNNALSSSEQSVISKAATLIKECQLPDKPEIELNCLKKYSQDLDDKSLAKVAEALTKTLAKQPSVNGGA
jgi:SpoVK/Ycf46/Vps4 family AAA+-type ATPase